MSKSLQRLFRCGIWLLLIGSALLGGALGEAAISGHGDLAFSDAEGNWVFPSAKPELWFPIMGFILFQGVLVFALIRTREQKCEQPLFPATSVPEK